MSLGKRIGVILILIGLCIPTLSMLFAENLYSRGSFVRNVQRSKIICWGKEVKEELAPWKKYERESAEKFLNSPPNEIYCIPLSLSFGLGIILIATGIGLVVISKKE